MAHPDKKSLPPDGWIAVDALPKEVYHLLFEAPRDWPDPTSRTVAFLAEEDMSKVFINGDELDEELVNKVVAHHVYRALLRYGHAMPSGRRHGCLPHGRLPVSSNEAPAHLDQVWSVYKLT